VKVFLLSRYDGESAYPLSLFTTIDLAKAAAVKVSSLESPISDIAEWRVCDDGDGPIRIGVDESGAIVFNESPKEVYDVYAAPILEAGGYYGHAFRIYEFEVVG
jgi:hypothetical protein